MEENATYKTPRQYRKRGNWFGLFIILVGVVWALRKSGTDIIPAYLLSWPALLVGFGFLHLIFHRFRHGFSYVMIIVGSVFLARNHFEIPTEIEPYIWPAVLVIIGLIILFKPRRKNWGHHHHHRHWKKKEGKWCTDAQVDSADKLVTTVIFSGVEKELVSKNFLGGEMEVIMGGANIDLSKADMTENASLEITVVMGGVKLIVPTHWDIKLETTAIAGGIEDRRDCSTGLANEKSLTITGTIVMGGLEIRSF